MTIDKDTYPWEKYIDKKLYKESPGWEGLAAFEQWFIEQLPEEIKDLYSEMDPLFQTSLYSIFCGLCIELGDKGNGKSTTR